MRKLLAIAFAFGLWPTFALAQMYAPGANVQIPGDASSTAANGCVLSLVSGSPVCTSLAIPAPGVTTNSSAAAGIVGEYVTASIISGSAVSLTTATPANVTSISLTAGDWDVNGVVNFLGSTISTTAVAGGLSSTTATLPTLPSTGRTDVSLFGTALANSAAATQTGSARFSLAGTTTVYLVGQCTFTGGTCTAYGMIRARRVR